MSTTLWRLAQYSTARHSTDSLITLVLGSHTRLFRDVFASANTQLMQVFGMQMVELPKADRVTVRQKRGMLCLQAALAVSDGASCCRI